MGDCEKLSAVILLTLTIDLCLAVYKETPPQYLNPDFTHISVEDSEPNEYMAICPSICELDNKNLLIVYHRTNGVDWMGEYSTWMRTSSDGGKTWTEPRIFANQMQSPGLLRLRSGQILLWGTTMPGITKNYADMLAKTSTSMLLYRSNDNGKTWKSQKSIWELSQGIRLQGGAATMIQLRSGRLLLPVAAGRGGNGDPGLEALCYISDNNGVSWSEGRGRADVPRRGAMSPCVAELKDGRILMSMRTQLGSIYFAISSDQGQTWSTPLASKLESPENDALLASFPDSGNLLLVYTDSKFEPQHHHSGERTPLSAFISRDSGFSWHKVGTIAGGPHELGPGGVCFTSDNRVVIAYCWNRIPWERNVKTGGVWLAITKREWFK
jgi:sialidase-1